MDNVADLKHGADAWPVFGIAGSAIFYRFHYSDAEWIDLGRVGEAAIP